MNSPAAAVGVIPTCSLEALPGNPEPAELGGTGMHWGEPVPRGTVARPWISWELLSPAAGTLSHPGCWPAAPNRSSSCQQQMKKNLLAGAEQREGPARILAGTGWG